MHDGNRLIFINIETSGNDPKDGHRIIEIAAIEYIGNQTSKYFHRYFNPEREINFDAQESHGLSLEFLQDKPSFVDVADDLQQLLTGAVVVVHNAPFDVGFLNYEFNLIGKPSISEMCLGIVDTMRIAKEKRPRQRNDLDALSRHYGINTSTSSFQGTLLEASILAQVYMSMIS